MLAVAATVVLIIAFAWMPADGASYRRLRRDTLRVSSCTVSGEPHYNTFDGQLINYQGICKHLLVSQTTNYTGSNAFQIYLRNEHRDSNNRVSFLKDVLIDLCGDHVEILRCPTMRGPVPVTVQVNNATVKLPYSGNCYSIDFNGNFVHLETTYGLKVRFNGLWLVNIQIPDNYVGVTHGMCGNNNEDADDDLTTADGTCVGSQPNPGTTIGNSYVVVDGSNLDQSTCLITPPENSTTCTDVDKQRRIADRCSVITDDNGVFGSCIDRVGLIDAQLFYSSCLYDACHFDESSICLSLEVFALECFLHGVQVTWRNATGCQLQCPAEMVPSQNACACQPTCDNPSASRSCRFANTEMCVCPDGHLLSNGQCVTCCGCVDSSGIAREAGSQWTTSDCTTFECTPSSTSTTSSQVCQSNITEVSSCPRGGDCINGACHTTPRTLTSTTSAQATTQTTTTTAIPSTTTLTTTTEQASSVVPTTTSRSTLATTTTIRTPTTVAMITPTEVASTTTTQPIPTTTTLIPTTVTLPTPGQLCQNVDGGFCEFGPWSDCVGGVQTRTREHGCPVAGCYTNCIAPLISECPSCTPTLDDGTSGSCPAVPSAGPTSDNRTCGCPQFNAQDSCPQCDTTSNPLMYVANPCNCSTYYQCTRDHNTWHATLRSCPPCYCWNSMTLFCSDLINSTDVSCRPTPAGSTSTIAIPTTTLMDTTITTSTTTTTAPTTTTTTTLSPTTIGLIPTTTTTTTLSPTTTLAASTTTIPTPTTTLPATTTTTTLAPTTQVPTTSTTNPLPTPGQVCRSVNGGFCEFEQWSECVEGSQTRTRACECPLAGCFTSCQNSSLSDCEACTPLLANGTSVPCPSLSCSGSASETRNCTVCQTFNPQAACSSCDLISNPDGYVANPCGNCSTYYKCVRSGHVWSASLLSCPPCLCFNPISMTCSDRVDSSVPLSDGRCQTTPSELTPATVASPTTTLPAAETTTTTTVSPTTTVPETTAATTTVAPTTTSSALPTPGQVCLSVNGGYCEFGLWSDCVNGQQTRTRACGCPVAGCFLQCDASSPSDCGVCTPTLADGTSAPCPATTCSGPTNETRSCTTCQTPNPHDICSECDLTTNPNAYVANPCHTSSYYQCARVRHVWIITLRSCPSCRCWNSESLNCSDQIYSSTDPSCPSE